MVRDFDSTSIRGGNIWSNLSRRSSCATGMLADKKINVFCKEPNITLLDESGNVDPNTMLLIATSSYFAELERQFIQKRLQSGRASYKEKGGKLGRPPGSRQTEEAFLAKHKKVVKELQAGTSIRRTAKYCNVSISTVKRVKKILNSRNKEK